MDVWSGKTKEWKKSRETKVGEIIKSAGKMDKLGKITPQEKKSGGFFWLELYVFQNCFFR